MDVPEERLYEFGPFRLDPVRRLLHSVPDEQPVALTPRAFDALLLLVEHRGQLLDKRTLMQALWPRSIVEENNLNQQISLLRRVLGEQRNERRYIVTESGRGYRFVAEVALVPRSPSAAPVSPVGRHWLAASERRLPLAHGENLIGRDPGASVWLDDPTISRRHARIEVSDAGARIEDLGSKNGTWLGDQRLTASAALRHGAPIRFGQVLLTYRTSLAEAAIATQLAVHEAPGGAAA